MEVISVTQVISAINLKEIVMVNGPDGGFAKLRRVFPDDAQCDIPGTCWIDLRDENEDLIGDPIAVTADDAIRIVKDYFKVKGWGKIRRNFPATRKA